jgi:hypothetical protein
MASPSVPAGIAVLARSFDPPHGSNGEVTIARDPPPQAAPRVPIPAPDFQDGPPETTEPLPPLAVGEFDPPPLGPADRTYTPLARPTFPEPDWREEERIRSEASDSERKP